MRNTLCSFFLRQVIEPYLRLRLEDLSNPRRRLIIIASLETVRSHALTWDTVTELKNARLSPCSLLRGGDTGEFQEIVAGTLAYNEQMDLVLVFMCILKKLNKTAGMAKFVPNRDVRGLIDLDKVEPGPGSPVDEYLRQLFARVKMSDTYASPACFIHSLQHHVASAPVVKMKPRRNTEVEMGFLLIEALGDITPFDYETCARIFRSTSVEALCLPPNVQYIIEEVCNVDNGLPAPVIIIMWQEGMLRDLLRLTRPLSQNTPGGFSKIKDLGPAAFLANYRARGYYLQAIDELKKKLRASSLLREYWKSTPTTPVPTHESAAY